MTSISIEFGALVKPIGKQLKEQGITISKFDTERFEKIAYSITFLHLQDIIPDSVRDKSRQKLIKKISNVINGMVRP